MKRLLFSVIAAVTLMASITACNTAKTGKNGELTGVMGRPEWDNPIPMGMVTIPAGSYHMGQNDQDVNYSQIAHNRQITMSAFYMDETEIENNEYRQFMEDMREGTTRYDQVIKDSIITFLEKYYARKYSAQEYETLIYPDTNVWTDDFSYAYNEPLTENYWWHPAFDKYPVVGVNWYAAQAFCSWRTQIYNKSRTEQTKVRIPRFRLPTEAEWEYSARGGFEHKIYPWEGPYIKNSRGCLFANF